jgi:hypothetical protein
MLADIVEVPNMHASCIPDLAACVLPRVHIYVHNHALSGKACMQQVMAGDA